MTVCVCGFFTVGRINLVGVWASSQSRWYFYLRQVQSPNITFVMFNRDPRDQMHKVMNPYPKDPTGVTIRELPTIMAEYAFNSLFSFTKRSIHFVRKTRDFVLLTHRP
jgi:hypothetical protein